ncbi:MAG TPA: metallophosphoesterase, partial [Anaerolineaceae bacterium]|nr:metallophosphoesterase [Anaerolineaceae bacterium]
LMLLDYILFALLPILGVSYGDPFLPWIVFAFLRLFLWIVFVGVLLLVKRPNLLLLARRIYWGIHIVLLIAILDGAYLEPQILTVSHVRLETSALPAGTSLKVVQLSDLHIERTTNRERKIPALVESLQPDIIVLTGDYLNLSYLDDPGAIADARSLLAQMHAPWGVFAVNGSVDSPERMQQLFDGLDIRVLSNEAIAIPVANSEITLIGLEDDEGWYFNQTIAALEKIMTGQSKDQFQLLLYHNPDLMENAALDGVDLYLTGHTHGGQVRLPFYGAAVTFSAFGKKYEMGRYDINGMTLYVSRGVGLEGSFAPRVRFLCPPEVVLIEIVGIGSSAK